MQSAARLLLLLGAPVLIAMSIGKDRLGEGRVGETRLTNARKCNAPLSREPQHFVDGRPSNAAAAQALRESDVHTVMVLCLSPIDHTIIKPGSSTPGVPAIAIWTAHGPLVQLEPLLKKINDAQQAHFAAHGAFATTLSALSLGQISTDLRVTLDATDARWRADAEVNRPTSPRCSVFDGALDVPLPGPKGAVRCSGPA